MSKIKLTGHASGSGVLTIAAPNTDTDRTITLPDVSGTLLDSGSTLDATKLTGDLPAISGANLTGISSVGGATGVDFNDNVKARFGTGNDAEIYHDGTHTYYKNSHASGSTRFNQKYFEVNNTAGTESMLSAYEDGAVTLRYDNSIKLETTADGVDVSGTTKMSRAGQSGGPATSGTTQVNTVAEFSGAGNQRLYVGTDTSSKDRKSVV